MYIRCVLKIVDEWSSNQVFISRRYMSEMDLQQPWFIYITCGLFTKNKERIQKFKEMGDSRYMYQHQLQKTCFQHDMAYGDFKGLHRRAALDKV